MGVDAPTIEDLDAAARRIAGRAHRTPVLTSRTLDRELGCSVFFKCENFQRVGAFKFRGATNAVQALSDAQAERGVLTHSSGNHAQALALAARQRGIPAWIVMPDNAPRVKWRAVHGYDATVIDCEPTVEAREITARRVQAETGAVFIHPYDNRHVIAGQSTAARELFEDVPDLDAVFVPVGGGGLASGTCLAAKALAPRVRVFGAEPQGADDAKRSLDTGTIVPVTALPAGRADTVADGLRTSLCERTFAILGEHLESIVCVKDKATLAWMRTISERMKIVIEPSAAVAVAALASAAPLFRERRVGVILSGGNV